MSDFLNELAYAGSPYQGKANLVKMNQDFMSAFDQMAHDYYAQTGKEIRIDDAWRSEEAQAEGYRRKPNLVAPPGHSNHPKGMAMDLDTEQANQLAQMGLLDKYGFVRPMLGKGKSGKNEPWHIELRPLEKEASAHAAEVKPDFMKELGAIDTSFGEELAAVTTGPERGEIQAQPAGIPPEQIVAPGEAGQVNAPEGTGKALAQAVAPAAAPILRAGGLVGGGIVGSGASPGAGTVAGAGLGFAMGKKAGEALEAYAGQRETPTIAESVKQTAQDIPTGAMYEMGGQIGGKVLGKGLEAGGKVARQVLGRMSGLGSFAEEKALQSGVEGTGWNIFNPQTQFNKALKGELTGEDVVNNAQMLLQNIKNNRAANYQAQLANVAKVNDEIDLTPLRQKVANLMKQYGAKVDITPKGELQFDTSRIAMGKKGRGDIEDILETVIQWGTRPGDKTPLGLDTLKRQLDDFYSESSQARAFVTTMRTTVKDLIVKNVPEYAEMTKGYAEATKMIKDIEAGLMMRKQGMTGRIVADQTLRRLLTSMKDNFELRRELVEILGSQGGEDIAGQIAGHAMNSYLPRGLAGLATITEGGLALAKFINPKIWPFLVASSPRVQGEFLQAFGRVLKETKGMSMPVGKVTSYLSLMQQEAQKDDRNPFKKQADTLIQQGKREDAVTLLRDAATKGKITVEKAVEWLGDTNSTMNQAPKE